MTGDDEFQLCGQCAAENAASALFCSRCGNRLPGEPLLRSVTRMSALVERWRRLSTQLTRKEVRKLLGEPAQVETALADSGPVERWIYAYDVVGTQTQVAGAVSISTTEFRVVGWSEPDWRNIAPGE